MKENEFDLSSLKFRKSIGIEVQNARLKKGQSINEFSKNCKISSNMLQYIENETGDIGTYKIFCICKYLGIDLEEFIKKVLNRMDML